MSIKPYMSEPALTYSRVRHALSHIDRCASHKGALAALKLAYARAEAIPWDSLPSDLQTAFTAAEMAVARLARLEGPEVVSSVRSEFLASISKG